MIFVFAQFESGGIEVKEYLKKMAGQLNIYLTDFMLEQFEQYYHFLLEKNKLMNLTAITEMKEVVLKHFLDSIILKKYIDLDNHSIIDIGTGAGFPGIPLSIISPDSNFTLVDSLNKRIDFLKQVITLCQLENVNVIHGRAEDIGRENDYREKFDYVVSRAVSNLSVLLEYCIPFIKVDGIFISYKSVNAENEIMISESAQNKLSCKLIEKYDYIIPETDYTRKLLLFRKNAQTDKKYPRQAGKPKKNPL